MRCGLYQGIFYPIGTKQGSNNVFLFFDFKGCSSNSQKVKTLVISIIIISFPARKNHPSLRIDQWKDLRKYAHIS
jgi:hypothetical protein